MDNTDFQTLAPAPGPESLVSQPAERPTAAAARPVLVAVDISWDSRAALLWAAKHAPGVEAPVTVLHVLHDPAEAPGKYNGDGSDPAARMIDRAEAMLTEFMAEVSANHPELKRIAEADTKVVTGLPAQTIVDEAVRLNAGLVVVGSRGQTGLPRMMYGSTAQKVVQLSSIPVTVVKSHRQ